MSLLNKLDGQSVPARGGDDDEVDHKASAKANLKAAGESLKRMLPDKTNRSIEMYARAASIRDMERMGYDMRDEPNPYGLLLKAIVSFPLGVAQDALELAFGPLLAAKDAADAALHGIAAGFRKR